MRRRYPGELPALNLAGMLKTVDRVQLAVSDRQAAEQTFAAILGAQKVGEDALDCYNAARTTMQAGTSEFELLQPRGPGAVAEHIERWGDGLLAAGFSTTDITGLAAHLSDAGVEWAEEGDQLFIDPSQTVGMRAVVSPFKDREPVGVISFLYEVTNVVKDWKAAANLYADAFGLDNARFHELTSDHWGYSGILTLFDPPSRLDRIEITQTFDDNKAMGRFHQKRGDSLYMCYVEAPNVDEIGRRVESRGGRWTRANGGGRDNGFIHPTALCGMLMGVSRPTYAWNWSGHPELVKPL
jgi:hypothetical protein